MNTIIKLFRRDFLAQFIIDLLNKERDIGIKGNRQQSPPTDKITQLMINSRKERKREREKHQVNVDNVMDGFCLFLLSSFMMGKYKPIIY